MLNICENLTDKNKSLVAETPVETMSISLQKNEENKLMNL